MYSIYLHQNQDQNQSDSADFSLSFCCTPIGVHMWRAAAVCLHSLEASSRELANVKSAFHSLVSHTRAGRRWGGVGGWFPQATCGRREARAWWEAPKSKSIKCVQLRHEAQGSLGMSKPMKMTFHQRESASGSAGRVKLLPRQAGRQPGRQADVSMQTY